MPNKTDGSKQDSGMQPKISDEQFVSILREHGTNLEALPTALLVEAKAYLQNNTQGENFIQKIRSEENEIDKEIYSLIKQLPSHDFSSLESRVLSQTLPKRVKGLMWVDIITDWFFSSGNKPNGRLLWPSMAACFSMVLGIVSGSLYSLDDPEEELISQNLVDELYLIGLTTEIFPDNLNISELELPE